MFRLDKPWEDEYKRCHWRHTRPGTVSMPQWFRSAGYLSLSYGKVQFNIFILVRVPADTNVSSLIEIPFRSITLIK
jgi:hypothetical protein